MNLQYQRSDGVLASRTPRRTLLIRRRPQGAAYWLPLLFSYFKPLKILFKQLVICRTLQILQIDARVSLLSTSSATNSRCRRRHEVERQFLPWLAGRRCAASRVHNAACIADAASAKRHDGRIASDDRRGKSGKKLISVKRRCCFLRFDHEHARAASFPQKRFQ